MSHQPPLLPYPPSSSYRRDEYDRRADSQCRSQIGSYGPDRRYKQDDRYAEERKSATFEHVQERDRDDRYRDSHRDRHGRRSRSRSPPRDGNGYRSDRHEQHNHRYLQPSQPPLPLYPLPPPRHNIYPVYPHSHPYARSLPPQPPPPAVAYAHQPSATANSVLRIGFSTQQPPPPISLPPAANIPSPTLSLPPPPPPPQPSAASYRHPPITDTVHTPPRCAFVWLVMKGDAYVPGALVSAFSVSLTNTPHSLVCMVTSDVSDTARSRLSLVFHRVVEIDYITAQAKPLRTAKQQSLYKSWSDCSFTKWQCLSLTDYDRVLFIDADKLILANIDHLFFLPAPAATFSSPWSTAYLTPAQKRKRGAGLDNPYTQLQHGDRVPYDAIERGFNTNSVVCIGTMVLLQPSTVHHAEFMRLLEPYRQSEGQEAPASFGYEKCHSMLDEQSLTLLYHQRLSIPFTYIHQRYNYLCWHRDWLGTDDMPFVFHYFSTKPWQMSRREWLDVEVWWRMAEAMLRRRRTEAEQRDELQRALGDGKQLEEERLAGCAWCKECKRERWEEHSLFDDDGNIDCPEMSKRPLKDGAEKPQRHVAVGSETTSGE